MEHPPCSPDLAPADYCLLPQLKSGLKKRHFCYATDIIKNATEELKGDQKIASRHVSYTFTIADKMCSCTRGLF
jgi:transposase